MKTVTLIIDDGYSDIISIRAKNVIDDDPTLSVTTEYKIKDGDTLYFPKRAELKAACTNSEDNNDQKHGHWKYWDGWMSNHDNRIDDAKCSVCNQFCGMVVKGKNAPDLLPSVCPHCKAKMDERE